MLVNNDTLRRIRYTFDFSDSNMISIFNLGGRETTREEISDWLKRDEDPAFKACSDFELASFLEGLIIKKRGKREDKPPVVEKKMTNNIILKKLKIALELKSEDIIEIMASADFEISSHELSALFRKSDHKNYRD